MCATRRYLSREYVRHPSEVPIRIRSEGRAPVGLRRMHDISLGGLSCRSEEAIQIGSRVSVSILLLAPPFTTHGTVVWCRRCGSCYELGIQFMEQDSAYAARMVEQLCYIEQYRQEVLEREGRVLDTESAAQEWIGKYASGFPSMWT